jgi:hypothetical protein
MAMDDVAGSSSMAAAASSDPSHGWQTVSYPKRNRKQAQPPRAAAPDLALGGKAGVFDAVEKRSQERHRALQQQQASRAADLDDVRIAAATGFAADSDDEDSDEAAAPRREGEPKKPKKPKVKKPKVTIAEAAALIDAESLAAHLIEISVTLCTPPPPPSRPIAVRSRVGRYGSRFCPFARCRIWVGFSGWMSRGFDGIPTER